MTAGLPPKTRATVKRNLERLDPYFSGGFVSHPDTTFRQIIRVTQKE